MGREREGMERLVSGIQRMHAGIESAWSGERDRLEARLVRLEGDLRRAVEEEGGDGGYGMEKDSAEVVLLRERVEELKSRVEELKSELERERLHRPTTSSSSVPLAVLPESEGDEVQ